MQKFEKFQLDLIKSHETVLWFANYLKSKGSKVFVPKLYVPKTEDLKVSDGGDMYLYRRDLGKWHTLEIKQLSLKFREKFPFKTIIVNSLPGIQTKEEVPDYHILISGNKKYAAMISSKTQKAWKLEQRYDSRKGKDLWFYVMPSKYVHIQKL